MEFLILPKKGLYPWNKYNVACQLYLTFKKQVNICFPKNEIAQQIL